MSERGKRQAEVLSHHLRSISFTSAFSSDLGRVRQTLNPFESFLDCEVSFTPLLRERGFGEIEGKSFEEYQSLLQASGKEHIDFRPRGGENFGDVVARADQFMELLPDSLGQILVLTHGGMVRALLSTMLGRPIQDCLGFPIENTSITRIERHPDKGTLLIETNGTSHISESSERDALGLDVHTKPTT